MTRKGLYPTQLIPFPSKLMNTAQSPSTLGLDSARNITNMIPSANKSGTGQKRFGLVELGNAIGTGVITHLMEYVKQDGSFQILAYTNDGRIHLSEDEAQTWTVVRTGLNVNGKLRHAYLQRDLIIVNGLDENISWDGTQFTDFSQDVDEKLAKDWQDENTVTLNSPDDISSRYAAGGVIELDFNAKNIEISSITRSGTTATVVAAGNVNVSVGDEIVLDNINPEEYEGSYNVASVVSPTTFTIEVPSTYAASASAPVARIKMVKGESIPQLEWEVEPSTITPFENSASVIPVNIQKPNVRFSGIRGLLRKVFGGKPDRVDCTIYYRKRGESEWIEAQTVGNIGTATLRSYEVNLPSFDFWELKFESNRPSRGIALWHTDEGGARAEGSELLVASEFKIRSRGNRLDKTNVVNITSLTRSGDDATATTENSHGLQVGDAVTVFDAEQEQYNITAIVDAVPNNTTFTYKVADEPATPATVNSELVVTMVGEITSQGRTLTVDSTSYASSVQTINFVETALPNLGDVVIEQIIYRDTPPPFSFIYSKHDRLWALSGGELKATEFRDNGDEDRLTVYYTTERDVINSWIDPDTQGVAFIDARNKHTIEDEFVGISSISGSLVFHGREALQIWQGQDPTTIEGFGWAKTSSIGTVHGDLIQELPDDVLFVSDYGIRSLSVAFQTEELEVGGEIGEAIDPTVEQMVRDLKSGDTIYRSATSFKSPTDGLYGFKANGTVVVYVISEKARGWVFFNGDFVNSRSFLNLSNGRLITGKNDKVLRYANGILGEAKEYNDDGQSYTTIWFTPWVELNRRWYNQYWQFITDNNEETRPFEFQILRFKDNDASSQTPYNVLIGQELALWDVALWDSSLWDSGSTRTKIRDKFKAESFAFAIISNNTDGGLNIVGVNALGA